MPCMGKGACMHVEHIAAAKNTLLAMASACARKQIPHSDAGVKELCCLHAGVTGLLKGDVTRER